MSNGLGGRIVAIGQGDVSAQLVRGDDDWNHAFQVVSVPLTNCNNTSP